MRFTRAIVRPPAATFAAGITIVRPGAAGPGARARAARGVLPGARGPGLSLVRLDPDPAFPDSTFVEDAAIVTAAGAILTRPGRREPRGRGGGRRRGTRPWFPELAEIAAPGTAGRGRRVRGGPALLHRASHRTNAEGAAQLAEWLDASGFSCERDRYPADAGPAAPQDRPLVAGWAAAARRRRARRARGAARVGGRAACRRARTTRPTASG